jgi:RuvB-like protein 2
MEARDAPEGMVKQLPARRAAGLVLQLIRQGTMIDRTKTQLFLR